MDRIKAIVIPAHHRGRTKAPAGVVADVALEQPAGRGTATSVLLALQDALSTDPDALLLVLPSDLDVGHEDVLQASVAEALEEVRTSPSAAVLLGIVPDSPVAGRPWVVPTTAEPWTGVASFVEKPDAAASHRLLAGGALWNSFILAVRGPTLLDLFMRSVPSLVNRFITTGGTIEGSRNRLRHNYSERASRDFFRHVLAPCAGRLRLLRTDPCGSTDPGAAERAVSRPHRVSFASHSEPSGSVRRVTFGPARGALPERPREPRRRFTRRCARSTRRRRPRDPR